MTWSDVVWIQANRAMRSKHDLKLNAKPTRNAFERKSLPVSNEATFGKPNRPQTPVNGIIMNDYGANSEAVLQQRYQEWKQVRCSQPLLAAPTIFQS